MHKGGFLNKIQRGARMGPRSGICDVLSRVGELVVNQ